MFDLLKIKKIATSAALFVSVNLSLFSLPVVKNIAPYFGDGVGGTEVVITGKDLSEATAVLFGNAPGTIVSRSKNQIVALSPPHVPGTLHVSVIDPSGASIHTDKDYFVYKGNWRAYAIHGDTSFANLAYVDVKTLTTSPPLTVGSAPCYMVCTSNGTKIFTMNYDSNNVTVVDTNTNTVIETIVVGNGPFGACITPDDKYVFVGNRVDGTVSVINTLTHAVVALIDVEDNPNLLAVSPNGNFVLVTKYASNTVSKIDVATLAVVTTFPVGSGPQAVAISPDSLLAVVCNNNTNSVSIINLIDNTVNAVTVGNAPCGVSITPDNGAEGIAHLALVTNQDDNTISFIDLSTLTVVATLNVGDNPLIAALSPDGSLATVLNKASDPTQGSFMIVDVANRQVVLTSSYADPEGVAITPNGLEFMVGGDNADGEPNYVQLGSLVSPYPLLGYSVPLGSDNLLILPDQAPLARFKAVIKNRKVTFDASESLSPTGEIAQYIWNFGDGSILSTTDSQVEHFYATEEQFTATLRVVNSAGNSVDKVYNYQSSPETNADELIGSTLFRSGGTSAVSTELVQLVEPKIYKLNPDKGKATTVVKIKGKGFSNATQVRFGKKKARILFVSENEIRVIAPEQKESTKKVYVTVTTPRGTSKKTAKSLFKYVHNDNNQHHSGHSRSSSCDSSSSTSRSG